jgi:nicotinate-nucleotide adenylyltransferase
MSEHIGLLGGTFDPVHLGHISIAESFLDSDMIDRLWILLTPYPPHKQAHTKTAYDMRLQMIKNAFSGNDHIQICTIENELPKPSYSVQTIRHLKEKYPDYNFYFCMGEDSLASFNSWKDYTKILEECKLLVAHRPGAIHDNVEDNILKHTHFVEHSPVEISSSQIKKRTRKGKTIVGLVPESVIKIIEKEHLYR